MVPNHRPSTMQCLDVQMGFKVRVHMSSSNYFPMPFDVKI